MLSKKEFQPLYEESVSHIKKIKSYNDHLDKNIGLGHDPALLQAARAETQIISPLFERVEELVRKMERSYLDPDTARKITMVRQQFVIQKDRREQLLKTIPPPSVQSTPQAKKLDKPRPDNYYKRSKATEASESSEDVSIEMHAQREHEIERKLLQERGKSIIQAHAKLNNLNSLVNETSVMVGRQGEKLDIIGDEMLKTRKNVELGYEELKEADETQRKSKKRKIAMGMTMLLAVALGIILLAIF